jgi:type II restriction enzyme
MKLGFEETQAPYESPSQSARAWTERWVRDWAFCPNCGQQNIDQFPGNRPVADFYCGACKEEFELKSQKNKFGGRVLDGAFRSMCERLSATNNPNLMLMNYDRERLSVTNLFVIPKHFFVREIIEERKPLPPTARRAGWIGCNILLTRVSAAGKNLRRAGWHASFKEAVLEKWRTTLFLRDESIEARGWLVEVMNCVDAIGRREFELDDVYAFEGFLSQLYPGNRHVKQKIGQQLQVLRDRGYLDFVSRGTYRLRA